MKTNKIAQFTIILCVFFNIHITQSQNIYIAKTSKIKFFAGTIMEDIDATNTKCSSFLNLKTGEVVIEMANNQFQFKRALMQEHFNENYMETEKYPKSTFKASYNPDSCDFNKNITCKVTAKGNIFIHGINKNITIATQITKKENAIIVAANFEILLLDFNIERPKILLAKLAEKIQVTVHIEYEVYKNY